jgi:hypothetical protein
MAKLNSETAEVFWYKDLEDLIKEVYDQDIRILDLVFEPSQDSYYSYDVNGESELIDIGDDVIVQKWIENPGQTTFDVSDVPEFDWTDTAHLDVNHILHRLYTDKIITAGKYLMTVWW